MWCFFALNYSTRRRNQTSGLFCRWVWQRCTREYGWAEG
jgi:hypothetical protein